MPIEVPAVTSSEQDTTNTPETELEVLEDTSEEKEEEAPEEAQEIEIEKEKDDDESEEEKIEEEKTSDEVDSEEETDAEAKITHPSWKTIKEKYPELAKDKNFRNIFFQNAAFTEVFPTIAEAKEAAGKAGAFEEIDSHLLAGDLSPILKSINEDTLVKLADKILPALADVNIKYFQRATRPLIIDVMNNVLEYADKTSDENLKKSIRNVSKFLTGNSDVPKRVQSPEETPEVKQEINKLRQAREELFKRDERNFLVSTDKVVIKKIEQLVLEGLDPEKKLTDFARQAVVERTIRDLKEKLNNDEGLVNKIKSIHKLAIKSGFTDIYKSRIVSATLDRAKKLAPSIRSKHKLAALGKQLPKSSDTKIVAAKGTEEVKTSSSRVTSARQIDTSRTSPEDFLNDKVTLRK